jgi:hypothetical protein
MTIRKPRQPRRPGTPAKTRGPAPEPPPPLEAGPSGLPKDEDLVRPRWPATPDERRAMIAEAAYHRAERRGFVDGGELEDWLAAEAEIDAALAEGDKLSPR